MLLLHNQELLGALLLINASEETRTLWFLFLKKERSYFQITAASGTSGAKRFLQKHSVLLVL